MTYIKAQGFFLSVTAMRIEQPRDTGKGTINISECATFGNRVQSRPSGRIVSKTPLSNKHPQPRRVRHCFTAC